MSRLFISHSSRNNDKAIEVRDWLAKNGWEDVFLDLDPERGIVAGQRWKDALQKAAQRCEMVLALISTEWLASPWCKAEIDAARLMGKKIIVALIGIDKAQVPPDLNDEQWIDLSGDPNAYKRLSEGLRRGGLDPSSFPFEAGRRPYPGFASLEENDAAIFFGRDAQIVRGLDKIRSLVRAGVDRMLVVLGASGSGKSSFFRAGLWPRLKRDDRTWLPLPTIRPERAVISGKFGLVQALQQVLADAQFADGIRQRGLPRSRADIQDFIEKTEDGLVKIFAALRDIAQVPGLSGETTPPPTVVLAVDQGEELFNEDGRDEARRFIEILTGALKADPHMLAILVMRSDSFPQLQTEARLADLPKDTFTLDMMLEGSYRAVIEGPARLVQPTPLKIDPQLTDALLQDVSGQDALPLLAFTLAHLYENYAADNELNLADYEKLGRLKGVIATTVREAFAEGAAKGELPKDAKAQLALARMAFIPHLARVNPAGQFVRRIATRAEIPAEARPLIDRFAERRLLIRDRRKIAAEDVEVIEVAHEAMLREWSELHQALLEEREFLVAKGQLEQDVAEWRAASERLKSGALLSGNKLLRAREWLVTRPQDLSVEERQFIKASSDQELSQRRSRRAGVLVAFILILGFAGYAIYEAVKATGQSRIAEAEKERADGELKKAQRALATGILADLDLRSDSSRSARQRNALWKLATADEGVRTSFISTLTMSPEDMARSAAGFEQISRSRGLQWPSPADAAKLLTTAVAVAVKSGAGQPLQALAAKLTEAQAQQAFDPLLKQISETTALSGSPATRFAALQALARALQALAAKLTEAQAQQALDPLLKQIGETTHPNALGALAKVLQALAAKLTAQQALDPLLKQISETTNPDALETLAEALQAVAAKLTDAQAQQALDPLLKQINGTTKPDALLALAEALQAVAAKPTDAQAQQVLDHLLKQINETARACGGTSTRCDGTDRYSLGRLAGAFKAVPAKLTDAQAQQALDPLLKQISETTNPDALETLAEALQAVAAKLTDAQAQQALDPLLKQINGTTKPDALGTLAKALQAVKLTDAQAQHVLDHLLEQINRTSNPGGLQALATALQALAAKLTEAQAQQAFDLLLERINTTAERPALEALATALQAVAAKLTEAQAQQALDPLLKQTSETTNTNALLALAKALQALAAKLTDAQAQQAQQALDPLLKQINGTTTPRALGTLAKALQAVKLTDAQAQQVLDHLLEQIKGTANPLGLQALAEALQALAAKLTEAQAQQAFDLLLKRINTMDGGSAALQAVAANLTDAQAQQALDPLLKQISETTNTNALRALAEALQAVAAKLTEPQAQQARTVAISSLAWAGGDSEAVEWARVLVALLPHATDQDRTQILVKAIVYPFAAGPATEVLLDALRARTDAPAREVGMAASLAWIAAKYPDQAFRPACPPPPQATSLSGLKCPAE